MVTVSNTMMTSDERTASIRKLLARLGPGSSDPRIAGAVQVLQERKPGDAAQVEARLDQLARDPDPNVARPACQWLSYVRENGGDPIAAAEAAERALALSAVDEGPWTTAMLHNQLAGLTMHLGDRVAAVEHASAALPVMERLGAKDDEVQLRSGLALCAIADGRLADAEDELQRIAAVDDGEVFGGLAIRRICTAELALARGDHAGGLRGYRECVATMRGIRIPGVSPTGLEPWIVFGESTAVTAHALYAADADVAAGEALFASCIERTLRLLDLGDPNIDVPVVGMALYGLGAWGLLRDATSADDAIRLLALAERFAYNRSIPTMTRDLIEAVAGERLSAALPKLLSGYGDRRPRDLLDDARQLVARVVAQRSA